LTTATPETLVDRNRSYVGVGVQQMDLRTLQRYGVGEALPRAVKETWDFSVLSVSMVGHMIMGDVSLKNRSGVLSIGEIAGASARAGLPYFLKFLAAVSISLGIINLLPIPLLDGGQIVYQLAEGIKGSPLSERAMLIGQQLGIFIILALTGFAFYNDVVRMFGS
jgi:regulator of sigma E protease